jgi:hypothetical protein
MKLLFFAMPEGGKMPTRPKMGIKPQSRRKARFPNPNLASLAKSGFNKSPNPGLTSLYTALINGRTFDETFEVLTAYT